MATISFEDTYPAVEVVDVTGRTVIVPVTGTFSESPAQELSSATLTLRANAVLFVHRSTNEEVGRSKGTMTFTGSLDE